MITRFLLLACLGTIVGCDNRSDPPSPETTAKTENRSKGPTTLELQNAPRAALSLKYVPLKLSVPPGWEVRSPTSAAMAFLQGPTPSGGEVQIQLSQRPTRNPEQLQYLIDGAKKEKDRKPESIKMADVRTKGELTILERQSIGQAISLPGVEAGIDTSPEYHWTINVFVPRGKESAQYELNFLGLTMNRFNADKDFLMSILNTLEPDSSAMMPGN